MYILKRKGKGLDNPKQFQVRTIKIESWYNFKASELFVSVIGGPRGAVVLARIVEMSCAAD